MLYLWHSLRGASHQAAISLRHLLGICTITHVYEEAWVTGQILVLRGNKYWVGGQLVSCKGEAQPLGLGGYL